MLLMMLTIGNPQPLASIHYLLITDPSSLFTPLVTVFYLYLPHHCFKQNILLVPSIAYNLFPFINGQIIAIGLFSLIQMGRPFGTISLRKLSTKANVRMGCMYLLRVNTSTNLLVSS